MDATDSLNRWLRANPNQVMAIVVALIVGGVSAWVGTQAREATAALVTKRDALLQVTSQLATVQQQFRVPTSTESAALIAESSRLGALGVPESDRLKLVDSIGQLAEACALSRVRVTSTTRNDSLFLPARTIAGQTLPPSSYDLAVEFSGGFAGVVKFVNSLPPSVSVSHFHAARGGSGTAYQMTLSIYQLNANNPG